MATKKRARKTSRKRATGATGYIKLVTSNKAYKAAKKRAEKAVKAQKAAYKKACSAAKKKLRSKRK